ncbi:hypothetical protein I3U56_11500 [Mycobacteroides abscessus subsp. abscessus]|nr:hypothetical protein [Mycobacteroides abscessus subsp. massiliense]MBN7491065.1 hypothetical protein [Mycobacteroides abscessus subsp. abscessus]MBN7424847.1 hypothetical protein [Mycobacteroides abscessus subsp. massiliense]MBN7466033.1 hypothetical protein [Mycobacteroides abscessus subsp. massiliense]MBN7509711.1 hypothetical protein [Mycobacteroides abscessus subsp. massiliense]
MVGAVAVSVHRWYRQTSPTEYPRERRAMVPGPL